MPLTREQFDRLRAKGLTPEQIAKFEAGATPQAAAPSPEPEGFVGRALATLPATGAAIGGMGGAYLGAHAGGIGAIPGGAAGAGLGGAAGRAAEQVGRRAFGLPDRRPSFMGYDIPQALDVPAEGLGQAGLELAGGTLVAGANRFVARPLMEKALTVPALVAKGQMTRQGQRRMAERALQERIPVGGRGDRTAAQMATDRAKESGAELGKLLSQAEGAGVRLTALDVTDDVVRLMDDIGDQPLSSVDRRSVMEMLRQFAKDHPGPLTPQQVKDLKRAAQQLAEPIIKKRKIRPGTDPRAALEARFNDAIATGARRALENIPTRMKGGRQTFGEAIAARERNTSELLELADQMRRAEASTSGVRVSPFGPFRPVGAMTPDIRLSRPFAANVALGITHPAAREATRQAPRISEELLEQLLYGEE